MAYAEGDASTEHSVRVNFNQNFSSLCVGTKSGYRLFPLQDLSRFKASHVCNLNENVEIVERLYNSSLVAIVTQSSTRKLKIFHVEKEQEITTQNYTNAILAVKLNRSRVVVCLEESLYIHNIKDMKMLHAIRDTPPNKKGILALSSSSNQEKVPSSTYLAYPGSTTSGEIQIFDTWNLVSKIMIPAHNSPIAAMAFNSDGTFLASASTKGTVIRVFCVTRGQRLYELRRGLARCATIHSLAFHADSTLLACSSSTETVHIFKLEESSTSNQPQANNTQEDPSWMNMFGRVISSGSSLLPPSVTEVFSQGRSFATAKICPDARIGNSITSPSIVGLVTLSQQCHLIVASTNGFLYVYNVDIVNGGECQLFRQLELFGSDPTNEIQPAPVDAEASPGSGGTFENRETDQKAAVSYASIAKRNIAHSSSFEIPEGRNQDEEDAAPQLPNEDI